MGITAKDDLGWGLLQWMKWGGDYCKEEILQFHQNNHLTVVILQIWISRVAPFMAVAFDLIL